MRGVENRKLWRCRRQCISFLMSTTYGRLASVVQATNSWESTGRQRSVGLETPQRSFMALMENRIVVPNRERLIISIMVEPVIQKRPNRGSSLSVKLWSFKLDCMGAVKNA